MVLICISFSYDSVVRERPMAFIILLYVKNDWVLSNDKLSCWLMSWLTFSIRLIDFEYESFANDWFMIFLKNYFTNQVCRYIDFKTPLISFFYIYSVVRELFRSLIYESFANDNSDSVREIATNLMGYFYLMKW